MGEYRDMDGNPCTLLQLVKKCPYWACSRVRRAESLEGERDRLRRALEVVEEQADQSIDDGGFEMGIRHIKNIAGEALEGIE